MKKNFAIVLVVFTVLMVTNCATAGGRTPKNVFELALITDFGSVDDNSFIRDSWEGLFRFAKERNISGKYYRPADNSEEGHLAAIDLAVKGGAKIIVTPGVLFEVPVFIAQDRYPNVRFILIDSVPRSSNVSQGNITYRAANNTVSILYAEDQAGFLAGYAAVKDGYKHLGFLGGMVVPSVIRFGYGFIQGIEYAANELGLAPGTVTLNYHYTGSFNATPEVTSLATSWYNNGIEVIFAAGGLIGNSVMRAAEQAGKKVIGVDADQSGVSATVITSAMKGLHTSVYTAISDLYAGRFPGGQALVFSAANNGVGLPMKTSKFNTFSNTDYDNIYQKLASGEIPRIVHLDNMGSPTRVPVTITVVTE